MSEKGESTGLTVATALQIWDRARWVLRKVPYGTRLLQEVRRRRDADQFRRLHNGVFQSMRNLAVAMSRPNWDEGAIIGLANDLCTEFNDALTERFNHRRHDVHCCWKTLSPRPDHTVKPFARSKPFDEARPAREPHAFNTSESTICAALTGGNDGITLWGKVPCFCSNDLWEHCELFNTRRAHWKKYYRSVLVFPLRYVRDPETQDQDEIGFLAFDSLKKNAFPDVPEVFKYRERLTEYRNALDGSPTYHVGAIFAETLSAYLHGVYNARDLERQHAAGPRIRIVEQGAGPEGGDGRDLAGRR